MTNYKGQVETLKTKNNVSMILRFSLDSLGVRSSNFHSPEMKHFSIHGLIFHFQDLRSKNRKAIEALNDLEQKYVKVLKEKK